MDKLQKQKINIAGIVINLISLGYVAILFYYNIFILALVNASGYVAIGLPFVYQYRNGLSESSMIFYPFFLTFNIILVGIVILGILNIKHRGLKLLFILISAFLFEVMRIAMITYFEFTCLGTSSMCNG